MTSSIHHRNNDNLQLPDLVKEQVLQLTTSNGENSDSNSELPNQSMLEKSDQSLFNESCEYPSTLDTQVAKPNTKDISSFHFENDTALVNGFMSEMEPSDKITNSEKECDLIDSSQSISDSLISTNDTKNSLKRFSLLVDIKRSNRTNQYLSSDDDSSEIITSPTKKRKITQEKWNSTDSLVPADLTNVQIVDVGNNKALYETFESELLSQEVIALSFACRKHITQKTPIGNNVIHQTSNDKSRLVKYTHNDIDAVGVAFSWGNNVAFYLSFESETVIANIDKVRLLRKLFTKSSLNVRFFDAKAQIKVAKQCFGLNFDGSWEDSKVADWLLAPDGKEKNLQAMVLKYIPGASNLLALIGHCKGVCSVGLDVQSTAHPKVRATVESVVVWYLRDAVRSTLVNECPKLIEIYKIEMKSLLCITKMELNGIKVDIAKLQALVDTLKKESEELQKQAFTHVGRRFSFSSPTEVAKIVGSYKGRKPSTDKQSLQRNVHPISNLVLQWRKLNSTLTRMIYPLIRLIENSRIFGNCVIHTSTGRITMHEPNLQNVPRDFSVASTNLSISCRSVFIPTENYTFLSADYCQLELRILTHFCQDPTLTEIMKMNKDVFKMIAAHWKNISETEVDDDLRQWTKQLCYGIIYGMGNKALAEHMSIPEDEAKMFHETFKKQYPNIQTFIHSTIAKCKALGYIETYAGRRRYLPLINSDNLTVQAQSERQAVNTTIQGSAADIAKLAMTNTESRFQHKYRHSKNLPKLVLHLHDELLYEVHEKYLLKTAKILKQAMEEVVALSIPLPVKLKSGKSWGAMHELIL
uniref:DNA-directed DNA polymerase family A palm domain-containing protein n=1 Tax=Photinus pyralis TaxID=7054 RepID=A0A1Y1ND15_PHOPY